MGNILLRVVILQITLVLIAGSFLWWAFGSSASLSFGYGSAVSIVPGWVFGRIVFKKRNAVNPRKAVNAFYYAEAIKLAITFMLFLLAFQWTELQASFLFLGLITAQFVYWVAFLN